MKTFNFYSKLFLIVFTSLLLIKCQEDDEIITNSTSEEIEVTTNQTIDPGIEEFLLELAKKNNSTDRVFFDPSVLEFGIRRTGQSSFQQSSFTCLRPNTSYDILATVPSSGPNEKVCVCLDINRNGIVGSSSPRRCRDTQTFSAPFIINPISFNFVFYTLQTNSSGRVNFSLRAGCGGNSPVSSFSSLPSGLQSLDIGISNSSACL
ncbi:hypothetical protein [uncultured Dokdonia sp.]|uniref:hypothetical protein n=1 Tax=uncultured Dokdonia sp. TaxID=575653 RepID=UPI0026302F22|nr:hypothetical protein [uncultured Dokdonia sp.]